MYEKVRSGTQIFITEFDRTITHRSAPASLSVKFRSPMLHLRVFFELPGNTAVHLLIAVSGAPLGESSGAERVSSVEDSAIASQTRLACTVCGASRSTKVISSRRFSDAAVYFPILPRS